VKNILIFCLLAAALVMAQRQSVVVLPTIADSETKLSPREQDLLTEKVRSIIPGVLPLKDFNLLKQDAVLERLGAEGLFAACKEGSCVGDLVSRVQADFGARVEVINVNKQLYMKFELYGTLRGEKDAGTIDQFNDPVKDFNAMLALLDKKVPAAFKKIVMEAAPAPTAAPAALAIGGGGVVAQITTEPAGATLEINGIPYQGCTGTPCAVSLYENRFKLSAKLNDYETADTNIVITMPNQLVNIKLKPIMYRVNFTSSPAGASLSFDDKPRPECVQTPCSAEFPKGNIKVTANLNMYGIEDSTILVSQNNQQVNFRLTQAFGTLRINPAYLDDLGMNEGWALLINDKAQSSYENKLSTGRNSIKLTHKCYEDILANVRIEKDKLEVFSMTHGLTPKPGGCNSPTPSEASWEKCGTDYYNTSKFFCHKENKIIAKCGINPQSFNPDLYECRPGSNGIFSKTPVRHGSEDYEAVLIGEQMWLQKNLNSNAGGGVCYNNDTINCASYGKLYDFETAKTACPAGWYLPSDAEWQVLTDYAGGAQTAAGKLKAVNFGGTDNYGFSGLMGGFGGPSGVSGIHELGYWHSSTESGIETIYGMYANRSGSDMNKSNFYKNNLFSVRCLRYVDEKQRKTSFFLNIASEPAGAALKFNGDQTISSCSATPCKVELKEGKYGINLNLDYYEPTDTTITIIGERYINIKLPPTFGILKAQTPDYLNGIGKNKPWNFTINNQTSSFGEIRSNPGMLIVKLTHECYNDLIEKIDIKKGDQIDLGLAQKISLKQANVLLNATYKGKSVSEPILVNGKVLSVTPFSGSVPLCSDIAFEKPENIIPANLQEGKPFEYTHKKSIFWSTFIGGALNLAGLAFLGSGYYSNTYIDNLRSDYNALGIDSEQSRFNDIYNEKEDIKKKRNTFYIVGSVLLISGIGVHIWF